MVRRGPFLFTALAAAVGGAAVYLVALPTLWRMSWPYGLVFAVLGIAQLITVGAALARPRRRRILLAAGAASAVAVLWALTRLLRMTPPPDPWVAVDSVIGFVDVLCVGLELVAVLGLGVVGVFAARRSGARPRWVWRAAGLIGVVPLVALVGLGSAIGVAASSDSFHGSGYPSNAVQPRHLPAGRLSTVEYCRPAGVPLAMDIYSPPATDGARGAPVALYVHGGGFIFGDRQRAGLGASLANHEGALFSPLQEGLNARGFVVASIDYRLPPATPWPAQIEDTKCAVRFLRAHATDLGIDPARIGVWGSSAGAQLACLLGLAGPEAGLDHGQYADQPSTVQAVADMFGCIDPTDVHDSSPILRWSVRIALGSSADVRRAASPGRYLSGTTHRPPPFLILQGTDDPSVRPRHAVRLLQQLRAAGGTATLIEVRGAGHDLSTPGQDPPPAELTATVIDFFTTTLT